MEVHKPVKMPFLGAKSNKGTIIPLVKYTQYFIHTQKRADRAGIREDWIWRVMINPLREQLQSDGRIRRWGRIEEAEGRILRVILLNDGETVHNAFFDRGFKE